MLKRVLLCSLMLVLLAPALAAAKDRITLDVDTEKSTYITTGVVVINATVSNPSDEWSVSGVSVDVEDVEGLTFSVSPGSATVGNDSEESFFITVSGMVWVPTTVTISASAAETANYQVRNGTASVTIRPPKLDLEFIYPKHEMTVKVAELTENKSMTIDTLVKNTGDFRLENVKVSWERWQSDVVCTNSTEANMPRLATQKFPINCNNILDGGKLMLRYADEHGAVNKTTFVYFKFVKQYVPPPANISAGGGMRSHANLTAPPLAVADSLWAMFRGGPSRTGYSAGKGTLGRDTVAAWTYAAGIGIFGSPAAGDLNGDGRVEIVVPLEKQVASKQSGLAVLSSAGLPLWEAQSRGTVLSSPAIADADSDGDLDVVFATNSGELYVLNGADGKPVWSIDRKGGFYLSSPLAYDVEGDGNTEIIIGYEGGIQCFDGKSGMEEWSYPTDYGVYSSPALGNFDGDTGLELAFGSTDGLFYTIDAESGALVSYADLGSPVEYSTAAVTKGGLLVIGTEGGGLKVVDPAAGKVVSSYDLGGPVSGSPSVFEYKNRTIIVVGVSNEQMVHGSYRTSDENGIYGIELGEGKIWNASTGGMGVFSSPAVADLDDDGTPEAVAGSREGRVYVVNAITGAKEWSYYDGTGMFSSPALADVDGDGYLEIVVAYRYSNQVRMLDSPDKPDLVVDSIIFSNEFPGDGEEINITVRVKNTGKKPAGASTLTVYRRSPLLDHPLANLSFEPITPGSSRNATFAWTTAFPQGEAGIYAFADSGKGVNETSENNNGAYKVFGNDLFITANEFPQLDGFVGNKTVSASLTVKNVGRADLSGVEVSALLKRGDNTTKLATGKADLKVGAERKFELNFTYASANVPQTLLLVIDPDGKIPEVYEGNNAVNKTIALGSIPDTDGADTGGGQAFDMKLILIIAALAAAVGIAANKLKSASQKKRLKMIRDGGKTSKRLGGIKEATKLDETNPQYSELLASLGKPPEKKPEEESQPDSSKDPLSYSGGDKPVE